MGMLGTCYQFGGAFASLLALFLVGYGAQKLGGDWRNVFLVPAVLFAVIGVFFYREIRNRPEDVGLSAVDLEREPAGSSQAPGPSIAGNVARTLTNPHLWIVARRSSFSI